MSLKAALLLVLCTATFSAGEEIMLPMRDGVKLHTVINMPWFSSKKTNLTAIIDRSPYGANALELVGLGFGETEGFVSVRQDQRGTQQSEGVFTFWHNAANDSYDTMAYLTSQPWSNGKVVSIGASADGLASYPMIFDSPRWLSGQAIIFATGKGHETIFCGGAWRQALSQFWLESTVPSQAPQLIEELKAHEAPTSWWDSLDTTGKYHLVRHPTSFWGGWYDIFLVGNLISAEGYQKNSYPTVRGQMKITIDPLGHCQSGSEYYYRNTLFGRALLPVLQAYDTLKSDGKAPGTSEASVYGSMLEDVSALTFYVLGADEEGAPGGYWTTMDDWPTFTPTKWYLSGNSSLSTTAPTASSDSATYKFDPTNPVPTMGGNNLKIKCGPLDQTSIEAPNRDDVLTFTSDVLTDIVAVTGPLHAELFVSSSAVDTDFSVKLTDVYPDKDGKPGPSRLIQDGIVRMRWRDLPDPTPKNMTAGQVYPAMVSLWNTSYVFAPGHRIRVSVSSSNYPRFSVNPNNGWPLASNGPNITATNTLYHDASHPSSLILPVVSMEQLPKVDVLDKVRSRVMAAEPSVRDRILAAAAELELGIAQAGGRDSVPPGLIMTV